MLAQHTQAHTHTHTHTHMHTHSGYKKADGMLSPFNTVHKCDRQMVMTTI